MRRRDAWGTLMNMRRRDFAALGFAALAQGCGPTSPNWTLVYRLRMHLRGGGEAFEGAGVYRTIYNRVPEYSLNQTQTFWMRAWGEAIVIDLGARGVLCGILESTVGIDAQYHFSPRGQRTIIQILPDELLTSAEFESGRPFEAAGALQGARPLPRRSWPILLHFPNPQELASVRLVPISGEPNRPAPSTPLASLDSILGDDAQFLGVSVEMADEEPVDRIEATFPWVRTMNGADGRLRASTRWGLHENLLHSNFKMNEDAG